MATESAKKGADANCGNTCATTFEPDPPTFDNCLRTPLVEIKLEFTYPDGRHASAQYHIPSGILTRSCEYFAKALSAQFTEGESMTVQFDDIDPHFFRYFVEYLYRDDWRWVGDDDFYTEGKYVLAARMYCLGERLQDCELQKVAFYRFKSFLQSNHYRKTIFELLRIVCRDLPERPKEDGLRALLFLYTYKKLDCLKTDVNFRELLDEIPDLGRYICAANHGVVDRLLLCKEPSKRFSYGFNLNGDSGTRSRADFVSFVDPIGSLENISNDTVRVYRILEQDPKHNYTCASIERKLLGDLSLSDINEALEELSCKGLVEEIAEGVWALDEE